MTSKQRAEVLIEVAERVALLNEFRTDDFQDEVARVVQGAREHWRNDDGELPRYGADATFDALSGVAESADGSPVAVRDACEAALREGGDARVAR